MTIQDLGYREDLETFRKEKGLEGFELGRVCLEHKERYVVKTASQEYDAELMGNLRYTAESRYDLPAVGDWVAFMEYDEGKAIIQAVFPRHSIIERKAVARAGQVQIIATNIDVGLIVQAVDRDFNLNRLERYLTICHSSKVQPIIILSKVDLISEEALENIKIQVEERIKEVPLITVSSESIGYAQVREIIEKGKTYCLLGSSGVGKSTLLNGISGKEEMKTAEISTAVNKGKHTTSHRELFVLDHGGILIDNPGMREVGITDTSRGLEMTFESILDRADECKFKDCTHVHETGCAIIEALENGEIEEDAYDNFIKMERERSHFESDAQERKKKDKDLGKLIKEVKWHQKKNKY